MAQTQQQHAWIFLHTKEFGDFLAALYLNHTKYSDHTIQAASVVLPLDKHINLARSKHNRVNVNILRRKARKKKTLSFVRCHAFKYRNKWTHRQMWVCLFWITFVHLLFVMCANFCVYEHFSASDTIQKNLCIQTGDTYRILIFALA